MILLETTGARTGGLRIVPVLAIPAGQNRFAVVADNFGKPKRPGWYFNLRSHPEASIVHAGKSVTVVVTEIEGPEHERIWQRARERFVGYDRFLQRNNGRTFPRMMLTPATQSEPRSPG